MLKPPTVEKLRAMNLTALAAVLQDQAPSAECAELPFEDRLCSLIAEEYQPPGIAN